MTQTLQEKIGELSASYKRGKVDGMLSMEIINELVRRLEVCRDSIEPGFYGYDATDLTKPFEG